MCQEEELSATFLCLTSRAIMPLLTTQDEILSFCVTFLFFYERIGILEFMFLMFQGNCFEHEHL